MENYIYRGDINLEHGGAWFGAEGLNMKTYADAIEQSTLRQCSICGDHHDIDEIPHACLTGDGTEP